MSQEHELHGRPVMRVRMSLLLALLACGSCGGSSLGGAGGSGGPGGTSSTGGTGGSGGTSSTGGTGGSGGTSSTGGTGGSGGTSGGVGGGPDAGVGQEAQLPRCLADLVAQCTCKVTTECGVETCFASGVTTKTTAPDGGSCNLTGDAAETRVLKPDGSLCYSVRISSRSDTACEILSYSWRDAAGQEVAKAYGYQQLTTSCFNVTPTITCTVSGETGVAPINWPHTDCDTNCQ
jgi:hypothetical protein